MKEYFIFYILLIILIVLLIFVILLYSDYHSRTIVPALLTSNYPVQNLNENWNNFRIEIDNTNPDGSVLFGNVGGENNFNNVSFIPLSGDEKRKMVGVITLLLGSSDTSGDTVRLRVVDDQTGKVIGDEGQFLIPNSTNWGLTVVRLNFTADQLNPVSPTSTEHHQIVVEGRSASGTVDTLLLNSAYISYY